MWLLTCRGDHLFPLKLLNISLVALKFNNLFLIHYSHFHALVDAILLIAGFSYAENLF